MAQKEVVIQWCPDCNCESRCKVINNHYIECETCEKTIPLAAEVARNQLL